MLRCALQACVQAEVAARRKSRAQPLLLKNAFSSVHASQSQAFSSPGQQERNDSKTRSVIFCDGPEFGLNSRSRIDQEC